LEHPSCQTACAKQLENEIERIGSEHIAAFVAEPIVGAAGGALTPPEDYYKIIKSICERYDILFIADEVMTGLGRTGAWFAMEHWGVVPDLIALGKGLTAGYAPMAATLVSDRVMEPILQGSRLVMAGHTFSANPLSAAVSLAVIEYVERYSLVENAAEKGGYLLEKLHDFKKEFPIITDVRGKGLLLGLELSIPCSHLIQAAAKYGLLLYPAVAGRNGKEEIAVLVAPPLTVTHAEIDELLQLLYASLQEVMGGSDNGENKSVWKDNNRKTSDDVIS
jgi:adenosylmethionine-8-amino-7-oxononanoate aminotransferase